MATIHPVQAGDCISSIAFENGFFAETLWDHPANSALKSERQDPNILMPGDLVHVPDRRIKAVDAATDARHRFKYKGVPAMLNLVVMHFGQPVERRPYTLEIDERRATGETGSDGAIRHAIPPNARRGRLVVDAGSHRIEIDLDLGHLAPVDEVLGFKQRLRNLGYDVGPLDDAAGETFVAAVRRFEAEQQMEPTGECNDANRARLQQVFGR